MSPDEYVVDIDASTAAAAAGAGEWLTSVVMRVTRFITDTKDVWYYGLISFFLAFGVNRLYTELTSSLGNYQTFGLSVLLAVGIYMFGHMAAAVHTAILAHFGITMPPPPTSKMNEKSAVSVKKVTSNKKPRPPPPPPVVFLPPPPPPAVGARIAYAIPPPPPPPPRRSQRH
jgi:hypothetical protein